MKTSLVRALAWCTTLAWLACAGGARGQTPKDRFLEDYRKAIAACEPRLWMNLDLTVTGQSFDETGNVTGDAVSVYHTSTTCMLVSETINPGNHLDWYLLRPEGTYRIVAAPAKPDQYILKRFNPGSF